MLQAAKLWEKTSAAGNVYLVGRLGGVRILILRNRAAGTENEPDWHLFFAEPTPPATSTSPASRPKRRAAPIRSRSREPGSSPGLPADAVDDLWPEATP
jgi:hypothetical protein